MIDLCENLTKMPISENTASILIILAMLEATIPHLGFTSEFHSKIILQNEGNMKLNRRIVNEYTPLHGVNAWIYSQLSIYTSLDTLVLMHSCLDIVALYGGNNIWLFIRCYASERILKEPSWLQLLVSDKCCWFSICISKYFGIKSPTYT